jgi:hypothetical protein
MENKRKHLEIIQATINRMANCSFLIKGWCITIVSALLALSVKEGNKLIFVALLPIILFWILDGFFLFQERLYRSLYDETRLKKEEEIDFSMNTSNYMGGRNNWLRAMFSKTLILLYFSLIIFIFIYSLIN